MYISKSYALTIFHQKLSRQPHPIYLLKASNILITYRRKVSSHHNHDKVHTGKNLQPDIEKQQNKSYGNTYIYSNKIVYSLKQKKNQQTEEKKILG